MQSSKKYSEAATQSGDDQCMVSMPRAYLLPPRQTRREIASSCSGLRSSQKRRSSVVAYVAVVFHELMLKKSKKNVEKGRGKSNQKKNLSKE
eukprot:scaffold31647_cov18-Prasinocladus_malaysianus.AAC.1